MRGQIITSYGRAYVVELENGEILKCSTRGKKTHFVCGDWVELQRSNQEQGVIESFAPRSSLLYRSDAFRSKMIAANVSQVIVVCAAEPAFSEAFLQRCLCACESESIQILIILNKMDLPSSRLLLAQLAPYVAMGYAVLPLAGIEDCAPLLRYLDNHTSLLIGQSGMGKSTLINTLMPDERRRTGGLSLSLNAGKHTTTHAHLSHLNATSHLIDSPGMQEFGLSHLEKVNLAETFPEFRAYLGQCRFANCGHTHEPNCAVQKAVQTGEIRLARWEFYCQVFAERIAVNF